MEDDNIYNFTLDVDNEERIDKLLANYFLEYSRSTIQKWIASKNVRSMAKLVLKRIRLKVIAMYLYIFHLSLRLT